MRLPSSAGDLDARETAPSPERNRQPILEVLARVLPPRGLVRRIDQHLDHLSMRAGIEQWNEPDPRRHRSALQQAIESRQHRSLSC